MARDSTCILTHRPAFACENHSVPRVVIAGLGLIGGSLALALRARGREVAYIDPAVPLEAARRAGASELRLDGLDETREGDLVVLAMPVDVALRALTTFERSDVVVTSVCSVMAPLRDAAKSRKIRFVAGHPFAGSEARGLAAARADLFVGRTWFIDVAGKEAGIEEMIRDSGATVVAIDPVEHDAAVALTSHLPQVISTALASLIAERAVPPEFLGSGLLTLLRLAGSAHSVWQPVIESNHQPLTAARAAFEVALRRVANGEGAEDFERANKYQVLSAED